MANSDCYFCIVKNSKVAISLGTIGNPFGCCQKCHSLTCGSHGDRLPHNQFMCLICDTTLASTSSAAVAETAEPEESPADRIIREDEEVKEKIIDRLSLSYNPKTDLLVSSLDQYIERTSRNNREKLNDFRRGHEIIWTEERYYPSLRVSDITFAQLRAAIESFPPNAKDLLFAAVLLVQRTEVELKTLYPDILLDIADLVIIKPMRENNDE